MVQMFPRVKRSYARSVTAHSRETASWLDVTSPGGATTASTEPGGRLVLSTTQSATESSYHDGDPTYGPRVQRESRGNRRLWLPRERSALQSMIEEFKEGDGRIRWSSLALAWEQKRDPQDPQRTVAALKAAYAKLRRSCNFQDVTGTRGEQPVAQNSQPNCNLNEVEGEQTLPAQSQPERDTLHQNNLTVGEEPELAAQSQPDGDTPQSNSNCNEVTGSTDDRLDVNNSAFSVGVDVIQGSRNTPADAANTSCAVERRELLLSNFKKYLKVARSSQDRVPIRRPRCDKIPRDLLEMGNELLADYASRHLGPVSKGKRYLSRLSEGVYAIARAIAATADSLSFHLEDPIANLKKTLSDLVESRRYLLRTISTLSDEVARRKRARGHRGPPKIKFLELEKRLDSLRKNKKNRGEIYRVLVHFKDRLNVTQKKIKRIEESMQRQKCRRGGASRVVRESVDPSDVPVHLLREYWKPIVGLRKPFDERKLEEWSRDQGSLSCPVRSEELTEEDWKEILQKVKPWKATGPDGIQGFWWKHLPVAFLSLRAWCIRALVFPRKMVPSWLCSGRVFLIPKAVRGNPGTRDLGDYRPITCLNTCYKILTSFVSLHISRTVGERFPREQVAMRKGMWGCTHAQVLDQTAVRDAHLHGRVLSMIWFDLTKAFDSLSRGAILWSLKKWAIPSDIRRLYSVLGSLLTVRYCGRAGGRMLASSPLKVRNGLIQGDTLSPLLFCLTLAPVSHWIRTHVKPYRTSTGGGNSTNDVLELSHIFYMDDLKIFTTGQDELELARDGVQRQFAALGLTINARKCATFSLNCNPIQLDSIPVLGMSECYKYLGAEQRGLVSIGELWSRVETAAKERARKLFSSDLTVRQKVDGYNQMVLPKLMYAFSCVIFGVNKLSMLRKRANQFDVDIRKLMEESQLRFRSNCVPRLYVERELGGLGLKSVEEGLERSITYTWCYLTSKADLRTSFQLAETLRKRGKRSITSDFQKVLVANGIEGRVERTERATIRVDSREFFNATDAARAITKLIRAKWSKDFLSCWKSKEVASRILSERGRWPERPNGLCLKDSFLWSAKGWVSSVVLRNIWAVQEGSLLTRGSAAGRACMPHAKGVCRMRCSPNAVETAEHIVSACSHWRTNIMVERHDDVARVLYAAIRRKYAITDEVNTHVPHAIQTANVVLHWNDVIWTSEGLAHNRPDILVWDKVCNRIWIIEISVSWFTRVQTQESRKLLKYGMNSTLPEDTPVSEFFPGPSLKACLQKDRTCRVDVIPIVLGTCGEVSSRLRGYVEALELPESVDSLIERMERAAIMGTHRLVKCHLSN
ncbi:reverse transcriptase [Oesophagostomum dentatum]|uniref:Reverse transcriptase n=1 Tax=Oesophagostomum dentatum TaxID=61180 RepID=A0A0B1SPW6_OESDE|nr:reverse transcriptase [Oesophagostomum dentatum]